MEEGLHLQAQWLEQYDVVQILAQVNAKRLVNDDSDHEPMLTRSKSDY